jgi:N-methylhydantoinase B
VDAYAVKAGEKLVFRTAGSGGWGDPLERPPAQVLADIRRDLVSMDSAERDYGVVIRDDMVDEQATAEKRAAQRAERGAPPQFDFGELPEGVGVG